MAVIIASESPLQDEVRGLLARLNATLLALTPAEYCSHMTAEDMAKPDTTLFVARSQGTAIAIGALRRHGSARVGEVKRMYTEPSHRGRGIGAGILDRIEVMAKGEGLIGLVLETGHRHEAAWRLYERAGFSRCGPVLDYPSTPYSVFYAKTLDLAGVAP